MTDDSPTPGESAELPTLMALAEREQRAGRLSEAAAAYRRLLAIRPDLAEAHNNLGLVLWRQAERDQAVASFRRALALRPDLAEAHHNLGNAFLAEGKFDEAAARFRLAVALRPRHAEAHNGLGMALSSQRRFEEAAAHFQQAVALKPTFARAHHNLGNVLRRQGRPDEAVARYEQALALDPNYAESHYNLGKILVGQGKLSQAAACFERVLTLRPDHAEALNSLGTVLVQQHEFDQAIARFEQALQLRPDFAEARHNWGDALRCQGKPDDAAVQFERALTLVPDLAPAQFGLASCYLVQEDYRRGWPAFEAFLRMKRPQPGLRRWNGEPLSGSSILLVGDHGLGDTIQFMRYARAFKTRGARVALAAHAALSQLLATHPDLDEFLIRNSAEELPDHDFYLPLLSVPGVLRTNASTIPREVPYLWADPVLTARWRDELSAVRGYRIGIVWQTSQSRSRGNFRSLPLAEFAPLARLPGVRLVSLQKGFGSEQIASVDFPVLDLSDRLDEAAGPFMDTAAVIRNLDLVVTVDSAVAHLAGALGAPVFLALPLASDWRWLRDRDDSPWYPTKRLFRQTRFGQWSDVFERIAAAVVAKMQAGAS